MTSETHRPHSHRHSRFAIRCHDYSARTPDTGHSIPKRAGLALLGLGNHRREILAIVD